MEVYNAIRHTAACFALPAACLLTGTGTARGVPPAASSTGELMNPAAAQRLELPDKQPVVQTASFWRQAPPVNQNQRGESLAIPSDDVSTSSVAESVPPDPAPLSQPMWLMPEIAAFSNAVPMEPPGAAIFVDDAAGNDPRGEPLVELAAARVDLMPSRANALLIEARALAVDAKTLDDLGEVIERCHQSLNAQPDRSTASSVGRLAAWAYNRRGELLLNMGDEHAAFDEFQEAIILDSDCWQALHNRGVTLARYAQNAGALKDFSRVVQLAPEFAVARYNRGEVYSQLERWQEAIDDYTIVLKTMPNEASLLAARAHAWHRSGNTAKAAIDYNQALRIDDRQVQAYVGRGNLFAEEGLYEQAGEDFRRALDIDPRSAMAYRSVAWLLSSCPLEKYRNAEKGIEAARRYETLVGSEDPSVLDTLAVAYANAGEFRTAIRYQQQAIVLTETAERSAYVQRLALYRAGRPYRTDSD